MTEIAEILGGEIKLNDPGLSSIKRIVFDTRRIFLPEDSLFIAISGEKRDGHQYLNDAWDKGIRNFLVSEEVDLPQSNIIRVENTLDALQALAKHHRAKYTYPVVAITGSNGKTITKEWLGTLLSDKYRVVKSPRSYNSQIGVSISVLEMGPEHEMAIIEAGISLPGEMDRLVDMVRPEFGIFTHFGDAHDEGFTGRDEKLAEKLKLFKKCKAVVATADDNYVLNSLRIENLPLITAGFSAEADYRFDKTETENRFVIHHKGQTTEVTFRADTEAAIRNIMLSIAAAHQLGLDMSTIKENLPGLQPVSMRTQLITENPEITIINDAWNADIASIHNAFSYLESEFGHVSKKIVLSDIEQQGIQQVPVQKKILKRAVDRFGAGNLLVVGECFDSIASEFPGVKSFPDTDSLIANFRYKDFQGNVVLLKGSRKFQLELLIPYLSRSVHATQFVVQLDAIQKNLRTLMRKLPDGTKSMAMVKAFAYGSGTWEVASTLVNAGADYLAVAYVTEGIQLRNSGIKAPIMVMNPDFSAVEQLYHFNLEPEIFNVSILADYITTGRRLAQAKFPIHLKLDTGMHRLGFDEADVDVLIEKLKSEEKLQVKSIFTHLPVADEPKFDEQTREHVASFERMYKKISEALGYRPIKHVLNTAGILRFPEFAFDMVRPGIGLYGIVDPELAPGIAEAGSLRTAISQIRRHEAGVSIGYGFSQQTERESLIATIPIGYADGIPRALGNGKISFLVHGKPAPTFGRVCMDMIMIDVTDIPEAQVGDEVVVFGRQGDTFQSVKALSDAIGSIPYEILAGISERVRRIYIRE